jgi:predicted PurR-regulated permease PerM
VLSLVTGMGLLQGVLFIYFYFLSKKEEWRKTLDNGLRAGIGDMVDKSIIDDMCSYIKTYGSMSV